MKKYIGIDLGGTFIKGGIVTEKAKFYCRIKCLPSVNRARIRLRRI